MIRAEYSVTFHDFLDSMKAFRKVSRGSAFIYRFDHWVAPGLGLLAFAFPVVAYLNRDKATWDDWYWLCFIGICLMVLPPLIYRRQMHQAYRQRVSLAENGRIVLEFDQEHLRFTIPGKTEVKYAWTAFTAYAATERVATLLVGRAAFHTIPKAALGPEGWSELQNIVRMTAKEL